MFQRIFGLFVRFFEAIGYGLTRAGHAVEYYFESTLDFFGRVNIGPGWFQGFVRRLFWPFAWLLERLDRMRLRGDSEIIIPEEDRPDPATTEKYERVNAAVGWFQRLIGALFWPFYWMVDRIDQIRIRKVAEDVNPDNEVGKFELALRKKQRETERLEKLQRSWVSRIGRLAMAVPVGIADFWFSFLLSRSMGIIVWGLPLFAIVGLLGLTIYQTQFFDQSDLAANYENALSKAILAGETKQADLFRLKLEQLGARTERGEFQTAMALAETGDIRGAYERMQQIAPNSSPGFPGAHFWIAQNLIDGKLGPVVANSLQLALVHLGHVKTRMGPQVEILFLEGLAYYRLEQVPAALNVLNQIQVPFPPASVLLMEIYQRAGQQELAREQAIRLQRQLQLIESEGSTLNEEQMRWRVAATQVIGDESQLQVAVEQWYRNNPDSEDARMLRGLNSLKRFDRWFRNPELVSLSDAVSAFREAADLVPLSRYQLIYERASLVLRQKQEFPIFEAMYQELLSEQRLSGMLLEFFGTEAANNSEWAIADQLFVRAMKASPEWGRSFNNRAYVIYLTMPERRLEALGYADRAIELEPDNADYRETRGMILFQLEKYEQAIVDLEIAINGTNELASIHRALAESHRKLGNRTSAELYEQQLKRFQ
jgi:tetratricopeptide (TPR) repeat protein